DHADHLLACIDVAALQHAGAEANIVVDGRRLAGLEAEHAVRATFEISLGGVDQLDAAHRAAGAQTRDRDDGHGTVATDFHLLIRRYSNRTTIADDIQAVAGLQHAIHAELQI